MPTAWEHQCYKTMRRLRTGLMPMPWDVRPESIINMKISKRCANGDLATGYSQTEGCIIICVASRHTASADKCNNGTTQPRRHTH
mmetsp:Transcript_1014/g.1846  ORF Transcript_1014/g.1846 Transcript_1014/m.1846 type:complete len:85 (+) Transcript_1014:195-449(+)